MIILITGASHTGKTKLAHYLMENLNIPYMSLDHLKMGLIRSGQTHLRVDQSDELTGYLWPIAREMIKTAIENNQDLIVEGSYIPFDFSLELEDVYAREIHYMCLVFSQKYIRKNFDKIIEHENDIETRLKDNSLSMEWILKENMFYKDGANFYGINHLLIEKNYERMMKRFVRDATKYFKELRG